MLQQFHISQSFQGNILVASVKKQCNKWHKVLRICNLGAKVFFNLGTYVCVPGLVLCSIDEVIYEVDYYNRSIDELRKDAVDTICALAVTLGADFAVFLSSVRKPMQRNHVQVCPNTNKIVSKR